MVRAVGNSSAPFLYSQRWAVRMISCGADKSIYFHAEGEVTSVPEWGSGFGEEGVGSPPFPSLRSQEVRGSKSKAPGAW